MQTVVQKPLRHLLASLNLLASNVTFILLFAYTHERHRFVFVASERKES
jgi:hypothetical protein